ncbi:diguanylate cyclase [Massilia sp. Root418]|uniref:DinB family protein n=1 Tax=Massilia sp. Root418 TaxID=1736532 RepID=UPI0006F7E0A1|nr:DinB family protein [Massilia sp. Root418]KQW93883.1 diguanylate cyclase [Massilia sp. Root418]
MSSSSRTRHFQLLSDYNSWMNQKLYQAAAALPAGEAARERGAYFGSLLGTLNHLLVADTIWLKRFAADGGTTPALSPAAFAALAPLRALAMPSSLDMPLFAALAPMAEHRAWLDGVIAAWTAALADADLDAVLHFTRMNGERNTKPVDGVLTHFFNHQTHHRGQATTLLSQAGVDVGVTDLLALLPNA